MRKLNKRAGMIRLNKLMRIRMGRIFNNNKVKFGWDLGFTDEDYEFHVDFHIGEGFIFFELMSGKKKGWSLSFNDEKKPRIVLYNPKSNLIYIVDSKEFKRLGDKDYMTKEGDGAEKQVMVYKCIPEIDFGHYLTKINVNPKTDELSY